MFGGLRASLPPSVASVHARHVAILIRSPGAVPGAVVATILGVDFYSMIISRKADDDDVRERPEILSAAPREVEGQRVLIVDEVTTSGATLRLALAAVRDTHPIEVRTATGFARTRGYKPDYFALETDAEVVLPWDHHLLEDDEFVANPRYGDAVD